jgi:hypothetical protein
VSINRWAARTDINKAQVVSALKAAKCSVYDAKRPLDLIVGVPGGLAYSKEPWTLLMEIKRPAGPRGGTSRQKHTKAQTSFLSAWVGGPVATVDGPEAALRAVGAIRVNDNHPEKA